ncbi:MAG: DUF1501 domain-containing protein [Verrucomicrobia bacterium]|nr:DUF1501 domain-containing protein [Verrucomicrobiota bacterium]
MNTHPAFPCQRLAPLFTRRDALKGVSCGFGYLAFAGIATRAAAADKPLAPKQPHFAAKAKRVIFLCMRGGPSHVDTFDYKPKLVADDGKPGSRPGSTWMAPRWKFAQHGKSGLWISELFPSLAAHADEMCLVRSMHTDLPAHPQAFLRLHTGSSQFVRPSLGAWTLYGLGTENENLPGFITITPPSGFGGAQNYGSSFLPAIYQGTRIGADNRPIAQAEVKNIKPPVTTAAQRLELDLVQTLNREALRRDPNNTEIEGVIESYELAFRMQTQIPGLMDLTKESDATKKLYGLGTNATDDFGRKCLLARRYLEAGVRFVEICHGNWDQHFGLTRALENNCTAIDKPIAGLFADLKQRGLLKDTLIVWGGEFGRTPYAQGSDGRDHNNKGFTLWMAGGGVKGGTSHGSTDDHGAEAVQGKVHIHDWHATMLHLLGLDHEKLTYRYAGRDFRLTDVKGEVVKGVIA